MSAVDRIRATSSSGARPVNSTWPASSSSSRSATSSSKQSPLPMSVKAMSSRPKLWTTTVRGPQHDVDAVLRPHDADVSGQVAAGPGAARDRSGAAPQPLGVRAGPDHGHVGGPLAAALEGDLRGTTRWWRSPGPPSVTCSAPGPQPAVGSPGPAGKLDSKSSGHRSWWSNTNRVRPSGPEGQGERPEDVRRVARLDHGEASGAARP